MSEKASLDSGSGAAKAEAAKAADSGSDSASAASASPRDPPRALSARTPDKIVLYPVVLRALESRGWICDYQVLYGREVDLGADGGQKLLEGLSADFLRLFGDVSTYREKRGDKAAGIKTGRYEIDFVAPIYQRAGGLAEFFPRRERSPPEGGHVAIFELTHTDDFVYKLFQLERNIRAYELYREQRVTVQFAGVATRNVPIFAPRIFANAEMQASLPRLAALYQANRLLFLKLKNFETDDSERFIWVRLLVGGVQVGRPFQVKPVKPYDVDSLSKAVKAEMSNTLRDRSAFTLLVKDADGNVLEPDAELVANTEETAYVVE